MSCTGHWKRCFIENRTFRDVRQAVGRAEKMVQEQEAAKAKFTQRKAEIEAETAIIKAKGEGDSIRIRGEALDLNPGFIDLQIVEKWDGKSPLVIGGGSSNPIMIPIGDVSSLTKK